MKLCHITLALGLISNVACSGKSQKAHPLSPPDSGTRIDAGMVVEDAGADAQWTTYATGYRCCFPDAGTSCCTGAKPNTCFAYGGGRGRCVEAGDEFDAKEICVVCCPGSERVRACDADGGNNAPPSVFVCLDSCGDGVCGLGEGYCNCYSDCPPPPLPPGTPIP